MTDSDKKLSDDFDWDAALAEWDKQPFEPGLAEERKEGLDVAPAPARAPFRPAPPKPIEPSSLVSLTDDDEEPSTKTGDRPASQPPRARGGLGHLFRRPSAEEPPREEASVITSAPDVMTAGNPHAEEPLRRPSLVDAQERVAPGEMFDPFAEPQREEMPTVHPRASSPHLAPEVPRAPAVPNVSADRSDEFEAVGVEELLSVSDDPMAATPDGGVPFPSEEPTTTSLARSEEAAAAGAPEPQEATAAPQPPRIPSLVPAAGAWEDERPAAESLPEDVRLAVAERAAWLEDEARRETDKARRARGLLAASELYAIAGDLERAEALAGDAATAAPTLALPHRQLRGLRLARADVGAVAQTTDAGLRTAGDPQAKLHETLLAEALARAAGDDEGAAKKLDAAARLAPADPRVLVRRIARALSRGEATSPALRVPDDEALAPLAQGLTLALRLRGVERPGPTTGLAEIAHRAQLAVLRGDAEAAARECARLAQAPELKRPVTWLAAALGSVAPALAPQTSEWLGQLARAGDELARRAMAARALERGDAALLAEAISEAGAFSPAERLVLSAFADRRGPRHEHDMDVLATTDAVLASALSAVGGDVDRKADDADLRARAVTQHAERSAGTEASRASVRFARLLAAGAPLAELEPAIAALEPHAPELCRALQLALSARAGQAALVSAALATWTDDPERKAAQTLAAALVAERAELRERAELLYRDALSADPGLESAARALGDLEPETSASVLRTVADEATDPLRAAMLRLEALVRSGRLEDREALADIESIHHAAPGLPFAAFLAERIGRKAGDVELVLRWVGERRAAADDALEQALDLVREALLVADRDPRAAAEKLAEAHRARPSDVGLRELYERLATDPLTDRAIWREQRAAGLEGPAKAVLLTEAAHEYERARDASGSLRAAAAAVAAGGGRLAHAVLERAEIASGETARLADELLAAAKSAEDLRTRREAYERLAHLDAVGRNDSASALLWHRTILEENPAHLPSLRYVEHALVSERRDDELEPIAAAIARALAGTGGGEAPAHAELASRLRLHGAGDWDGTREMVELAAKEPEPSLWALRMSYSHALVRKDDQAIFDAAMTLLDRANRPSETATLCVRAAEAALRLGRTDDARSLLERAVAEDAGDVVAWRQLAALYERTGATTKAAEAYESLARSSVVEAHQLEGWYESARLWLLPEGRDEARAVAALEACAALDVTAKDVFDRLMALYLARGARAELAALLERRIATVTSPEQRVELEVARGRALGEVGDLAQAREAFDAALAIHPDHIGALEGSGELAAKAEDWERAEQAWVQLARLRSEPEEQKKLYLRLGELYSSRAVNLARAELAYKEVLRRDPEDIASLERLVDVYRRQNDAAQAIEAQQQLLARAKDVAEKRKRLVELALIHEQVSHDVRKAEQTLEAARREFPSDVGILRALAEFYLRHRQTPAVNILLDRAAGDARRAFQAGRLSPALFETMATVYELRGREDAANVARATLAAFTAQPCELRGAAERALDPRLDDLLAPETLAPGLRAILGKTGVALDAAAPFDAKRVGATPLAATEPIAAMIVHLGQRVGVNGVQVLQSPQLRRNCVAASLSPAVIVVGDALAAAPNELARAFLILRALKQIQTGTAPLCRAPAQEAAALVGALLRTLAPSYQPPAPNPNVILELGRRIGAAMPKNLDPNTGVMALEAVGQVGQQPASVATAVQAWANRVALLAIGDPNAALDAIAWSAGLEGAPGAEERGGWILRTAEAKDLLAFCMSDAYAEARTRLGFA
jgi:lipoprotein NlpI